MLVLLLCTLWANAQEHNSLFGNLTILDSIVVKKRCADAVRLDIRISFLTEDTVTLYQFNKYVNDLSIVVRDSIQTLGIYDAATKHNMSFGNQGLFYIIEDENGNQVKAGLSDMFISYVEEPKGTSLVFVDDKKLKIRYEKTDDANKVMEYDMAKTIVPVGGLVTTVYPMIVNKLKRGRYKLFLCYSQGENIAYEQFDSSHSNSEKVFHGVLVSNKIELIVK